MLVMLAAIVVLLTLHEAALAAVVTLSTIGSSMAVTSDGYISAFHLAHHFHMIRPDKGVKIQLSFAKNIAETYLSRSWSMYSSLQDPTMTHVLLADVDIDFRASDVERLLAFDADVAAIPALLHRSRPNFGRVLQGTAAAVLPGLAFEENVKLLEQDDVPDPGRVVDGFIRVKSVGFGLVLIKRHVVEELVAFFPETWVENQLFGAIPCMFCTQGLEGLLEQSPTDYIAFAERVRALGWDIWADTTRVVGHTGRLSINSRAFFDGLPGLLTIYDPLSYNASTAREVLPHVALKEAY